MANKKKAKLKLVVSDYKDKENPIRLAYSWFNPKDKPDRLRVKDGAFYLDGYPLNLDGVMRTLNAERQEAGMGQIDYNDRWVV